VGYKYEIIFTPAHHQEVGWLCNLNLRSYNAPLCTKGDSYSLGQSPSQGLEVEATFKDKVFSSANQKECTLWMFGCLYFKPFNFVGGGIKD
jgi:hypothetical protein